jgi:hypothetical protein
LKELNGDEVTVNKENNSLGLGTIFGGSDVGLQAADGLNLPSAIS